MAKLSLVVLAASAAALLIPDQQPLNHPELQMPISRPSEDHVSKPFVTTEGLQDAIKVGSLWKRAEKLYEIAKKAEEEYGHPTRVIGSKGVHLCALRIVYESLITPKPCRPPCND